MEKITGLAKRIIIALDVKSKEDAFYIIKQLDQAEIFKVGLKLFASEGPQLLRKIKVLRKKIFLDLKLHDIPNTVAETVKAGVRHGVDMMTLHASGGREMLARAVEAAKSEAEKIGVKESLLLAVTVLTSLKEENLKELGIAENPIDHVLRLAMLARQEGVEGVVCSPQEIKVIKEKIGKDFIVVVPGIRPSWAAAHDQKRIMTPSQAIQKGADYLVVGRPILEASSPHKAYLRILEEIK
ncbi:MAG: orotidine-5'-phosphate decarboxylase [Candidatus Aminicenantaceae bacterium]